MKKVFVAHYLPAILLVASVLLLFTGCGTYSSGRVDYKRALIGAPPTSNAVNALGK